VSAPTYDLGKLHGGLRLPGHKSASTAQPIRTVPIPERLILPITQHVGDPAQPVVGIGERVLKGQLIATSEGSLGAPIHASSSGRIVAIEPWPVSRRHGDNAPCIIIECDGEDRAVKTVESQPLFDQLPPEVLLHQILRGGIVGLGGAVFPTAQKLMQARTCKLDYLILNGVECEPYISCDDVLMREHAVEVAVGAQILMHALQLETCYIAIESDKPEAIHRLAEVMGELDDDRLVLKLVPTIYPSGGENQLVQLLANREVPSGRLPTDVGCLVQNVGTVVAIHDWIINNEPLVSRITTVTGDGVAVPTNVRARIGTPVADIIEFVGGYTDVAEQLIIGGPMTGKSVSDDRVPLVKATNCILVLSASPTTGPELACIRCGDCYSVCPVQLLPQQLFWYACADDEKGLRRYGLTDCIECGCCDLACPCNIPLTANFRRAKGRMQKMASEKTRAERARRRFEARNERLKREQHARSEELGRQKESARTAGPAAIAEILKRKQDKTEAE